LQLAWTFYNLLVDRGKTTDEIGAMATNKVDNFPDYFLFELTKIGMSVEAIAAKLSTTPKDVEERLGRYMALATIFDPLKVKLDEKIKAEFKHSSANIG